MKLIIMTRGREGRQHTWNALPPELKERTVICCPPHEKHPAPILPEPHPMNYSQKFQWILDGAGGNAVGKVVILDDDLRYSAKSLTSKSLIQATPAQLVAGFFHMEQLLDIHPLVGFHARAMGNNCEKPVEFNGRVNAMQGLNLDLIGSVKVDHYPILADMFLNLTLLTRGQTNAIICDPFWDQVGSSNAPGGCSIHRTWDQQREAVMGLRATFPDFVKVKEKVVKDGWWGPDKPRFDFIIQWKKAYEYGKNRAV